MSKQYAFITGASGLLGKLLTDQLHQQGFATIGLKNRHDVTCQYTIQSVSHIKHITQHLALVVNLAGAPIAGQLWTRSYQEQLRDSRITQTEQLIDRLANAEITVDHFISGSAIGYYGIGPEKRTESDTAGQDFSALLCRDWETAAKQAQQKLDSRVSIIRTGLVLTPRGGFLEPLWQSNRFSLGAVFGSGEQGISWIDYRDWLAMVACIYQQSLTGIFNLTAPNPVSQSTFANSLAAITHRKRWLKIPSWLFAPLGQVKTLFIEGQFVMPTELERAGYHFQYPTLEDSLKSVRSLK